MTRTLFSIGDDVLALNDLLDDLEGDLSRAGEMEPAVTAWLTSLDQEQAAKLDSYANLILQLEMEAAAAKEQAEQFLAKHRSRDARARYLRDTLKHYLTVTGQPKVQTATGRTIAVTNNGGVRPVVYAGTYSLADVPEDLVLVRREVDRAKVREALEAGRELPFAVLGERGTSLRIK